jgi:hypothetical protein
MKGTGKKAAVLHNMNMPARRQAMKCIEAEHHIEFDHPAISATADRL